MHQDVATIPCDLNGEINPVDAKLDGVPDGGKGVLGVATFEEASVVSEV
jgi:hypothetical protein